MRTRRVEPAVVAAGSVLRLAALGRAAGWALYKRGTCKSLAGAIRIRIAECFAGDGSHAFRRGVFGCHVGFSPCGSWHRVDGSSRSRCWYTLVGRGLPTYLRIRHRNPVKISCNGQAQRGRMRTVSSFPSQPIVLSRPLALQLAVRSIWCIFFLFASGMQGFSSTRSRTRTLLERVGLGLLAFGRLAHDPQCILTAVHRLALVGIELPLDGRLRISPIRVCAELRIASFADSECRDIPDSLYDPKIAFWHDRSLAHQTGSA